jgi:hypothetical protein
VTFLGILVTVNASLAFASEAALYSGLLASVASQAEGSYLPPGTKIDDPRIQGMLIGLGV